MSDALKPCPFCGGAKSVPQNNGEYTFWRVCVQIDCGAEGPITYNQDDANAAWNRREPPPLPKPLSPETRKENSMFWSESEAREGDILLAEQAKTILSAAEIALTHLPGAVNAALAQRLENILESICIARASL